jgi:hypothetical protein
MKTMLKLQYIAPLVLLVAVASLLGSAEGQARSAASDDVINDDFVGLYAEGVQPTGLHLGVRDGRYYPYMSPFGGRRIGFRSAKVDKKLYKTGLSTDEATQLLRDELATCLTDLQAHLKQKYPTTPFDKLSTDAREMLLDFTYWHHSAANVPDDVYKAVLAEKWQSFIHDMAYVRMTDGSPDNSVNRAFADRWIYTKKLK